MTDTSAMTVFLGPQTRLALAINGLVRAHRQAFAAAGLNARPSRLATPDLRKNLNRDVPVDEGRANFAAAVGGGPVFLSAVNFLGTVSAGFHRRELFPESEAILAELPRLAAGARIVLAIDRLDAFFLAAGSEPLETRVRLAGWEPLYDISWADLIEEVSFAMPSSEIVVLTPRGAATRSPEVLALLFGEAAGVVPSPWSLFEAAVSETGRAVLSRRLEAVGTGAAAVGDVYDTFAVQQDPEDIAARLGIDKVTGILLEQRFGEDLKRLSAMPRVEVI